MVNKKINAHKKSEILHDEIKTLFEELRQDTKTKWDRVLPFEDMLLDK